MAQRRQVQSGGFLANLIQSVATEASKRQQDEREGQRRVKELLLAGQLRREEQAADPEFQAKQEALQAITQATPLPSLRMSRTAPPEAQNRLQELFRGRMTERLGERAKLSEMFGLAPKRQPPLAETLAELRAFQGVTGSESQGDVSQTPSSASSPAEFVPPTALPPGQVLLESGGRALGRSLRVRETQKKLMDSYSAKTAQAARGFGDTANIAVEERKMIAESFPRDGDSVEGRAVLKNSLLGAGGFFDSKVQLLTGITQQPVPQILKGYSKSGPRYEADPTILAEKRQAITDLSRLRQTRLLYQQMFDEADHLMPAIGSQASGRQTTPTGQFQDGQTATNPQTGQRIIFRNGQWQPQ